MDDRVKVLEAAIGTGGEVGSQIDAKINALDATVGDASVAEGKHIAVQVVETDGKITAVNVAESDIASAQALNAEIQRATEAEQALANSVDALAAAETGRVSKLETKVEALISATHFEGVVEFNPAADNATSEGYDIGDIVIYGNKEFILDKSNKWVELGDTTAVSEELSQLGATVSGNTTAIGEVSTDLNTYKTTVANTYATKEALNSLSGTVGGHATKLGELEAAVELNTEARTNHAGRIETLESVANGLANNYVSAATYASDKQGFEKAHEDLGKEIDDVVSDLSTLSATVSGHTTTIGQHATNIAAADAKGAQGIADAAAALAKANEKVASVTGGADVAVTGTTEVTLSLNKATVVASGDTKAVTADAVFQAMCWVEF